jgi:hypothetical protein
LPKGATISELAAWWIDSSFDTRTVYLYRRDPVMQTVDLMGKVESVGWHNNYHWSNNLAVSFSEGDDSHMYWLVLSLATNIKCYGARIAYTPAEAERSENNH